MKKLLFVLACAASLGLWISCNNEAQDVNLKIDTAMVEKEYTNYGTVTATKVTMVTKRGVKVAYDDKGKITIPTDRKDYYIDWVETLSEDGKKLSSEAYWFYNDWDSGTEVTFDAAKIEWSDSVGYWDGVAHEEVSNGKCYKFRFYVVNDDMDFSDYFKILNKGSGVYQYYDDTESYGTAVLDVSGNLEGDFTIGTLRKKLDSLYGEKEEGATYGWGDKYERLDARTEYEPIRDAVWIEDEVYGGYWDYDVIVGYEPRKISANTSVYYLTNVSFTKN